LQDLGLQWVILVGLMKWGFALDWMLSGRGDNSTIGHLNKSYP
jgi:hypothetical protein